MTEYLNHLARKFPATKFVKSISTTCIPNYPDSNLPTIFIYYEGDLKQQFAGPRLFSLTTTQDGMWQIFINIRFLKYKLVILKLCYEKKRNLIN